MDVFFSVIIPTLNEEAFLPDILSCLVSQTYKEFEVIVVDGHSEDRTVLTARRYARALPKLTILPVKKRNVSFQRNNGAKKAQGKYLVFFDADVKVGPTFLEEIHRQIDQNHYLLLTTDIVSEDRDVVKQMVTKTANFMRDFFAVFGKPSAGGYNIIVEKETFQDIKGFDQSVVHGEDVDLLFRFYKKGIILQSLATPKQIFSFRRYERYGYVKSCRNMITSTFYFLTRGPIKKELFDYPMGGGEFKK